MDLITLDFESYYNPTFGFKNMTTEEYVRDPRFEVIGVSVKVNDRPAEWASGSRVQTAAFLAEFDWANSMVLAHNTKFDGAILSWLFGIKAKVWADTLSMARAVHGTEVGASLKALAEMYGIGEKGTEVVNALGKHREDFTPAELGAYGDYCINDTELCYKLFLLMGRGFPRQEMRVIDTTLRMFLEPVFELDLPRLEQHLIDVRARKEALLDTVSVTKKDLMSNPKFAAALEALGVTPPMKISLTTGKPTFAFAKSDEGFKALLEHEDLDVQLLAEARLGNKSSLEETRTERFIGIAKRGKLPIPIRYYAAHTGRWGGDDKINLQNLPSRGVNGKALKSCIIAPEGYTIIDPDSSQIEARVLAWLAGQYNIVAAFSNKQDVYSLMAADIYFKLLSDVSGPERFIGKQTVLGCGYGMGADKFRAQLASMGVVLDIMECRRIINAYRTANDRIVALWKESQQALISMVNGTPATLGRTGVLEVVPKQHAIKLPSGLLMRYTAIEYAEGDRGPTFSYKARYARTNIYGGKVVENVCQAIARCIIAEQMLRIQKYVPVRMTVHDSLPLIVRDADVDTACKTITECMRWTPDWAAGLPLDCELKIGKNYGELSLWKAEDNA